MSNFGLNIKSVTGYGNYENKGRDAAALFVKVFNMPTFQAKVSAFVWNGQNQFANNEGLTNNQIYDKLMAGAELASPTANSIADINLQKYGSRLWPFGSAIGYSDVNKCIIYTKINFIISSSLADLAGHYAHEYCHMLGFEHDFDATPQRPFSVPYAIGNIVAGMAQQYFSAGGNS